MRKILFLIIVVFSIISLNKVNTAASTYNMLKKLYVVSGSNDTLDYPGYKLIETNINYNTPGIYTAFYMEDITDRKFVREVEVVSKETLLKNGIKNVNLKEEIKIENASIMKRITTNLCSVIVYEKDENVCIRYQYIDSYDDINLFNKNEFGFVDLIYSNEHNKLYLIGNLFTNSLNVYIAEYNLNGKLVKEKIIQGDNVDMVSTLHVFNNFLYITGQTTSTNNDFEHTGYLEDSYIMKINIENFDIIKYLNLGEIGIDYIKTSAYLDNLYIIKHLYDRGIPIVQIIKLDDDLKVLDTTYLGTTTNITDVKLKETYNELYYFCNVYNETLNDSVSTLYKISKDLNIKKIDEFYDELSQAVDLNIVNDEISLLYTSISKEDNYPTYLRIISDVIVKFTLDNRIYNKCYFNELGFLDLLYGENLKCFEYSLVYAKTLKDNNISNTISPFIMCNNNEIKEDTYMSNTYYDKDVFGKYNLTYYYKFEFFDLVFKEDLIVDSNILIDNDNCYNVGLRLTFKGKGYLNGDIIESDYIINIPGDYELKVIGYNNETLIYHFKIVNNDSPKDLISTYTPNLDLNVKEQPQLDNISLYNNNLVNNIVDENYDNNIWYIIIPIFTLIISISTFMFIGRKVK